MENILVPVLKSLLLVPITLLPIINPLSTAPVFIAAVGKDHDLAARLAYGIGAATASFVWFFGLGYGARMLAPLFARKRAWQILDMLIAAVMALLSMSLLASVI